MTPENAMRQAHETAYEYAVAGDKCFRAMFPNCEDNQARATFISGFMQASAMDLHSATLGGWINGPLADQIAAATVSPPVGVF